MQVTKAAAIVSQATRLDLERILVTETTTQPL